MLTWQAGRGAGDKGKQAAKLAPKPQKAPGAEVAEMRAKVRASPRHLSFSISNTISNAVTHQDNNFRLLKNPGHIPGYYSP